MSLLPFFQWMESLGVFQWSPFLGPVFNLFHLLSMVVFASAVFIVDLRLLGRGFVHQPLRQIAQDAQPWLIGGLFGLTVTGVPAMMSTATVQYANWVFWLKMAILAVAVIFTFTVRRRIALSDTTRIGLRTKVVGLVSIAMWTSVAATARLIMLI